MFCHGKRSNFLDYWYAILLFWLAYSIQNFLACSFFKFVRKSLLILVAHAIGLSRICWHFLVVILVEEKKKGMNLVQFGKGGKLYM